MINLYSFNLKKNINFNNSSFIKNSYYNNKINSRNFSDILKNKKYLKYLNNILLNNIYYCLEPENNLKKNITDFELLFEILYFINLDSNIPFFKNIWKNIPSYSRFILILILKNNFNFFSKRYEVNLDYIFEHFNFQINYSFLNVKNIIFEIKKVILKQKINKFIIFKIKILCKIKKVSSFTAKKGHNIFIKNTIQLNKNIFLIKTKNILQINNIHILNNIKLYKYLNLTNFEIKNLQLILFQKKKLIYNLTILQNNAFITLFDYTTSHVYFVKSTAQLGFTGHNCCSKYALSILLKIGFSKINSLNLKNLLKFKLVLSPFINNIYYITYYFKEIMDYLQIISDDIINENDILEEEGIDNLENDLFTNLGIDSIISENTKKYLVTFNSYNYVNSSLKKNIPKFYFQKNNYMATFENINKLYSNIFYISTLPVFNGCRSRKIRKKKIRHSFYLPLTGSYYRRLNKNNLFK